MPSSPEKERNVYMAKYRIKVEALDPAEELRAEYRIGIECDRFVILSEVEGRGSVEQALHNVNRIKIAEMIVSCNEMMSAAMIARGMLEADEYQDKMEKEQSLDNLIGRMFGGDKQ